MNTRLEYIMTEPVSSSVGGWALMKFVPPILGPILATVIVMSIATPKSRKEWVAALTSTVAVSIFGGSFIATYMGWTAWNEHWMGTAAITGMCFISGLPAWLAVRALFAWQEKQKGKDITQIAKDIAKDVHEIRDIL